MTKDAITRKQARELAAKVSKIECLLSFDAENTEVESFAKERASFLIDSENCFIPYRCETAENDEHRLTKILLEAKSDLESYRKLGEMKFTRSPLFDDVLKFVVWPIMGTLVIGILMAFFNAKMELNLNKEQKQLERQFLETQKQAELKAFKERAAFQADYNRTTKLIEDLLKIQLDVYTLREKVMEKEQVKHEIRPAFRRLRDQVLYLEREFYAKTRHLPYPKNSRLSDLRTLAILQLKRLYFCLNSKFLGGGNDQWIEANKRMNSVLSQVSLEDESLLDSLEIDPNGEDFFGYKLDPSIFESLTSETNDLLFNLLGSQIYKRDKGSANSIVNPTKPR